MVRKWKMSLLNGFMRDTPGFAYSTTFDNNSPQSTYLNNEVFLKNRKTDILVTAG